MKPIEKIPFEVDITRIITVLADQIYQSPFALLRENTQNAYDAVLMLKQREPKIEPCIEVSISETIIQVKDNGIGMTTKDLREHYWKAGSSSKNTPEARKAGVVGTFGIGAMANFGIAEELEVTTESAISSERTTCVANKNTLSATNECITFETQESTGKSGTTVTAKISASNPVQVEQAVKYIEEFVMFLPFPVFVNGEMVSQKPYSKLVSSLTASWEEQFEQYELGDGYRASLDLIGSASGEVMITVNNLVFGEEAVSGQLILRQGGGNIRTFRSGFGLATAGVSSFYQFGGVADLQFLEPTAGREALTSASMQMIQEWITRIENFVSERIGKRVESNLNTHFMRWVIQRGRYDLCGNLEPIMKPERSITLGELREETAARPVLIYKGSDPATIALASDDRPLLLISRSHPRNNCEIEFLTRYCQIEELPDTPTVLSEKDKKDWTLAESALVFRLVNILSLDYFLSTVITIGEISHGLPIVIVDKSEPVQICLSPKGQSFELLISVYDNQYQAFDSLAKDFVRTSIFPHVRDLVPSSTRQGADAFLRAIHRSRELFEYDSRDSESLMSIWQDYAEGLITFQQAANKSAVAARQGTDVIESASSGNVRDVVPDIIENAMSLHLPAVGINVNEAAPPIQRLEIETDKKLLLIGDQEQPLLGFKCFLAISERIRRDRSDFFVQPHKTSIVWGGQRVLFVFEHLSGAFGLYYDVQSDDIVSPSSGGGAVATCTIIMKNRIFIPVPDEIKASFIPESDQRKRLHVSCDILYTT